jgi:hypothetical protein
MGQLILRWVRIAAGSPVKPRRRREIDLLVPGSAKTRSSVSAEMRSDFAIASALGLAGTETREASTSSYRRKCSPTYLPSILRGSKSSVLKPTETALRMPAAIKRRISSMRAEVPSGASCR